ncbi:hypothetical protein SCRM01_102c [Synechococcus phage S-CRM01]|uniref:hypothetical protein n=1 Tax=Synechococcus phage S-CRM01 TaxID=1026955 RepID=UPI000209E3A2|nr:hypothetical protein SCRM01_102c [Synechococcus phage S-CRM01]AEC53048.1 hypothetical protein SCRM01_102c [Synechococcus phage S-CRM01]
MHKQYRIEESFDINYDDPNLNPKSYYRLQRKRWWGWQNVWPEWPPYSSKKELMNDYYRYIAHETRTFYHDL